MRPLIKILVVLFLALLFGFLLVPKFGIAGAIYTIVFTQFVRMILSGIALKYVMKKKTSSA